MLPDSSWSNPFNKSEIKLNPPEMEWRNFMNECLMGTEIFEKDENEKCLCVDPNFVMDVRHRMVKQSTKLIPIPQVLIHVEALKLLRIENHSRLLRQKEGKMVEKEISKLKQMLENHRLFTKKKINETTSTKSRPLSNMQKFPKHTKLRKRLESHNKEYDAYIWQCHSVQTSTKSKISKNTIPSDAKVFLKQEKHLDEFSEPISTQKGSIIKSDSECKNKFCEVDEGKNEIIKRFFKKEIIKVEQELQSDVKEPEKNRKNSEIENLVNQKRMEHAWSTWKVYIEKFKSRKREKTIYKNKIETFLMKLKEKEMREEKLKQFKNKISSKQKNRVNLKLENRTKKMEKQMNVEEREERLKKLMKEIKTSQMEATQKLKEIRKNNLGNQGKFSNVEFLKRMEERRAERLKRRREIEEKKRKMEEEREKAQREKEEEERRLEEEYKRKSFEEFKEKRRLEKERKEEQKKEKEKLRLNMRLAENHYEKYLLCSYGLRPWGVLVNIRHSQNQHALTFFESRLKEKFFRKWATNAREQVAFRIMCADAFYEKVLKRKCLLIWVLFHKEKIRQDQVAMDWSEFKIIERAFKRWLNFTQDERKDHLDKKYAAKLNYERKLKMKCLTKLRGYPEVKKLEQAKENRKRKWRQKVKEILPDYRPVDIADIFSIY